jgi:transketolase
MSYQRSWRCDDHCEHRAALHDKSWNLRQTILALAYEVDKVHLGSSFSSAELMTVLYYHELSRTGHEFGDYLITSARSVLTYAILADLGFIATEELRTLGRWGTTLDYERVPGLIHMPFGPLGHSLSFACGVAQGLKVRRREANVYCVLGDGELNEGSIWEAALTAGHRKLDNLIAVVDRNSFQLSGATENVKSLGAVGPKFECFGWTAFEADGHSVESLVRAFAAARRGPATPKVIVARTVKGFGVSFMENQRSYHSTAIGEAEYRSARQELSRRGQGGTYSG